MQQKSRGKAWSDAEVEAIIDDYLDMLRKETMQLPFSKALHRRALLNRLNHRTESSIEFKHQNISAALTHLGIPHLRGYLPAYNYQNKLLEVLSARLSKATTLIAALEEEAARPPTYTPPVDILAALQEPPRPMTLEQRVHRELRQLKTIVDHPPKDYLDLEARNQLLGSMGEDFILQYERARLAKDGLPYLAETIEQVSKTLGPTAGYDIRSYETDGSERLIEVKTTRYSKGTPFYLTQHELETSMQNRERYFLYRVFDFRLTPALFTLKGAVAETCFIQPIQYVAWAG